MVALIIRDATNTARTITELRIRDAGNVQRTITELWIRDVNNVSRLVFNPSGSASLAVATDNSFVSGTSLGSGTATTDAVMATASGGTAPYTYAWTLLTHNGSVAPSADSPASATTTFTQTSIPPGDVLSSSWRVTATDANSNTATADVDANFADFS